MKIHHLTQDDVVSLKLAIERVRTTRVAYDDARASEAVLRGDLIGRYADAPSKMRSSHSAPPIHEFSDCGTVLLERV